MQDYLEQFYPTFFSRPRIALSSKDWKYNLADWPDVVDLNLFHVVILKFLIIPREKET